MKWALGIIALTAIAGCTTAPKKETTYTPPAPVETAPEPASSAIDYNALQNHLHMDRERESLGYSEKSFNTCDAGYGYSRSQNCHKEHFVVIHFRLLCRDSEGTISTVLTEDDVRPLDRRTVRWSLKGTQGTVQTDNDGYGQIVTAANLSQKTQRLRLAVGNEFLYMRANEIQKVITPQPWCNQY
ncbi:hypothetical protein [Bdellovibrio sp. HCB-162]|uniref:hypothetical protein n=1 Tax=Bdellovibrio sp. HCB-162 TaxID=3394234 RepID=UPI0039BD796B